MAIGPLLFLVGVALFAAGIIVPILLGWFLQNGLLWRLPNALVGLASGCIPAFVVVRIVDRRILDQFDPSQPLSVLDFQNNVNMLREGAIFAAVAIVCAAIVLFVLRAARGRGERPSAASH